MASNSFCSSSLSFSGSSELLISPNLISFNSSTIFFNIFLLVLDCPLVLDCLLVLGGLLVVDCLLVLGGLLVVDCPLVLGGLLVVDCLLANIGSIELFGLKVLKLFDDNKFCLFGTNLKLTLVCFLGLYFLVSLFGNVKFLFWFMILPTFPLKDFGLAKILSGFSGNSTDSHPLLSL